MLSQRPLKLFSFLKFLLLFSDWLISIILSSRSLMHSSVSRSLLLTLSSVFFLFVCYSYCNLQIWLDFLFIFCNSLLKLSLCSSILFPIPISILITKSLNFFSCKLFICFISCFSCSCFWNKFLCLSFWLNVSVSMELGETVTYPGLVWEQPCAACAYPVAFLGELGLTCVHVC